MPRHKTADVKLPSAVGLVTVSDSSRASSLLVWPTIKVRQLDSDKSSEPHHPASNPRRGEYCHITGPAESGGHSQSSNRHKLVAITLHCEYSFLQNSDPAAPSLPRLQQDFMSNPAKFYAVLSDISQTVMAAAIPSEIERDGISKDGIPRSFHLMDDRRLAMKRLGLRVVHDLTNTFSGSAQDGELSTIVRIVNEETFKKSTIQGGESLLANELLVPSHAMDEAGVSYTADRLEISRAAGAPVSGGGDDDVEPLTLDE